MWFRSMPRLSKSRIVRNQAQVRDRFSVVEPLEQRWLRSAKPSISVGDVSIMEGNDGVRNAVVTISLSTAVHNKSVAVNFRTEDGTANAGSDYQSTAGTLTFARGETRKTI